MPITTAAENNIDVDDGYERAVCVYVRAIADERVRASKCFDQMPPSPPPPPPTPRSHLANMVSKLIKIRDDSGQANTPETALDLTNEEEYRKEHEAQSAAQLKLIDRLSEENFQLRDILSNIRNRITSYSAGRRLWERSNVRASHKLPDNVIATEAFGTAPIVGVTIAECQSLCHAIDDQQLGTCKAIAFARNSANPRDLTLRECYLLRQIGGCSAGTFAGAVFLRRDTDGCSEPTNEDNPLCVQLSNTRTDLHVLDFAAATTACRQGRGRPTLAWPKTVLEAFSMLGYARERGVTAFWSDKPNEGGTMVWSGLDGQPLNISAGDKRCVLVSTVDTSIHGFMYAKLKPCTAKLADGVVCESAQAFPPPPPHGAVPDTIWKPPPPPPPIGVTTSMDWFTRKEVIPRTSAICLAGFAETDLVALCMEFANTLSRSTKVGTVGSFTPLCQPACFHSCGASSNQDRDGFENCRGEECADTTCGQFLLTECPPSTHVPIQGLVDRFCFAGMPFPPPPPTAQMPPPPPRAPPPFAQAYGTLRLASAEVPSDEDCAFVTYSACRSAAIEVGTRLKLSTEIEVQLSSCERGDDTQACFLGCSLGAQVCIFF